MAGKEQEFFWPVSQLVSPSVVKISNRPEKHAGGRPQSPVGREIRKKAAGLAVGLSQVFDYNRGRVWSALSHSTLDCNLQGKLFTAKHLPNTKGQKCIIKRIA